MKGLWRVELSRQGLMGRFVALSVSGEADMVRVVGVRSRYRALVVFGVLPILFCVLLFSSLCVAAEKTANSAGQVRMEIFGKVLNSHNIGVGDAAIQVLLDGIPLETVGDDGHGEANDTLMTESDGSYQARFWLQAGAITDESKLEITAYKPSFTKNSSAIKGRELARDGGDFIGLADLQIDRTTGPAFWIATVVFVLAYILISFELLHRTMAAMLGASLMLVISYTFGTLNPEYHILSYESAIKAIDMNVIFLLMGMMIIVGILKHTGIFQWCAYKCYQLARGNVYMLAIILMSFTAFASAFLDNVTTMLLLTPVTIEIAVSLGITPLALLIPEILASSVVRPLLSAILPI